MKTKMMYVQALSPLHVGTGQSTSSIELPIARDRATDIPYLPGSGIKGCMRAKATELAQKNIVTVFGPDTDKAMEQAGALSVGDAHLLLFPVRSVAGTFAYVTSPWLLTRFVRDAEEAGQKDFPALPQINNVEHCAVAADSMLEVQVNQSSKVVFEDLDLSIQGAQRTLATEWAKWFGAQIFNGQDVWQQMLQKRLCIVHDDVMSFLAKHATDVVTRVSIDHKTQTAQKGQLWTEESLPVESILASLVLVQSVKCASPDVVFGAWLQLCVVTITLGGII